MVPAATEWSPPSTRGNLPASNALRTMSACLVQVAVISLRYLALGSPSFFCSAMATAMLPPSSTTCPSASRRASRPATRTADGPMSTPRRDWPRSSGTPRILIFLGTILSARTGFFSVVSILGGAVVISGVMYFSISRVNASQGTRKRDGLTHVLQAANPAYDSLDSHPKPGMRDAAIFAQIQVPLESRFRQPVITDALEQQVVIADALGAANDLSISFRGQDIDAQCQLRTLRVGLHVKRFDLRRITVHHDGLVKLR